MNLALSTNFTIIYILFSTKVFLLVKKREPEAVEQQGELQNDGSLSLVAPRSLKRRKTRNLKFSSWKPSQNAVSVEVSDMSDNWQFYDLLLLV